MEEPGGLQSTGSQRAGHDLVTSLHFSSLGGGLPQWLSDKEPACNEGGAGDVDLIPGPGRSHVGERGNRL